MNPFPKIGALRKRVTIEAPIDVADDEGGFVRSYAPLGRVWARIEAPDAREQFVEQRLEQSRRIVVTLRWRDDVTSQMRFDFRGRKLLVRSVVDPDESRRFLRCECEETS